jgi:hypothetical protein
MRLQTATIAISLASLPFIVPHVVEDFAEGIAQRVGLSTGVGAFLLGGWLALQSLGLVLLARDRRTGWIITFWVGLVWAVVAAVDHGPPIVTGPFRTGLPSVVWVLGLVVTQAAASALAWRGRRRARFG